MSEFKERGNALFLILIAVALFAALSFAITQSGRGGAGNSSSETNRLIASQMMQYGATLEQGISRMMLRGGCTDTQINMYSAAHSAAATFVNSGAPGDKSCDVFDPDGAGVTFQKPPAAVTGLGQPDYNFVIAMGVTGVGTDGSAGKELTLMALVPQSLCREIDKIVGAALPGGNPPTVFAALGADYIGLGPVSYAYPAGWLTPWGYVDNIDIGMMYGGDNGAVELYGKNAGCYQALSNGYYYFYYVIYPR